MRHVPDVLPVHRLKKLMTLDLLHAHGSDPVLSIVAIPEMCNDRLITRLSMQVIKEK